MSTFAELKRRNRLEVSKRRAAEERDAIHFLLSGHDAHAERCIFTEKCSREYDAMPYAEAALTNEHDYVDTGIGALYGLGGEQHLWTLAGWNVKS
jgi:hypothetical protein